MVGKYNIHGAYKIGVFEFEVNSFWVRFIASAVWDELRYFCPLKVTAKALKIGLNAPKGKDGVPIIYFQVLLLLVSGRAIAG